jgi:hypothetical protein
MFFVLHANGQYHHVAIRDAPSSIRGRVATLVHPICSACGVSTDEIQQQKNTTKDTRWS